MVRSRSIPSRGRLCHLRRSNNREPTSTQRQQFFRTAHPLLRILTACIPHPKHQAIAIHYSSVAIILDPGGNEGQKSVFALRLKGAGRKGSSVNKYCSTCSYFLPISKSNFFRVNNAPLSPSTNIKLVSDTGI